MIRARVKTGGGPTQEPITLQDVKDQARLEVDDENALIVDYIIAAREFVENETDRTLLTTTYEGRMDGFPGGGVIEFPRPPLASVTFIKYVDIAGTLQTVTAADYVVDLFRPIGRVYPAYLKYWPAARGDPGCIQLEWVSGWTSPAVMPASIRNGMKMLCAHWVDNRIPVGELLHHIPLTVMDLLRPCSARLTA